MLSLLLLALATAPAGADEAGVAQVEGPAEEYGPFFEPEAVSDTEYMTPERRAPLLSVRNGFFCFVEDSMCKVSLLASADVATGLRILASDLGPDLPYAHFNFRGGLAVRPLGIARGKWNRWGLGVISSWSRGTGATRVEAGAGDNVEPTIEETKRTDAWRIAVVNQLWLSQKRQAFHIDFTLGAVRSNVLTQTISQPNLPPQFGTHAEVAFGWGGWGAMFVGADFLDRDARAVVGFRAHGIAGAPIVGLLLAGLGLGGAL